MINTTRPHAYKIFIALFIILNMLNTYFLTTSALNRYIAPFPHTFIGEFTAILGNIGVLLLFVLIGSLIFKSVRGRMIYLTILTLILNFYIFLMGIFNLYYGTAFSIDTLNMFNNPAEGFAGQTALEVIGELFTYYRIVVFVPFFVLTTWMGMHFKGLKGRVFTFDHKKILMQMIAIFAIVMVTSVTFTKQLKTTMPIQSAVSSFAIQNYGVYPFYLKEFLGFETKIDPAESLGIETSEEALSVLETYNKNVSSYVNAIDGLTYSNRLTVNQANIDYIDPTIQNGDYLNGILAGKNIVLIHLESLSYFLLQNEYTKANMTFLSDLLSQSYVFENFYANVGMGVSSDAELSVLTGLNPQGDRTLYWDYNDIPYELPSIVKYLNNEGYQSTAIHGDRRHFYNRNVVYPELFNFDTYYSLENFVDDGYDVSAGFIYNQENQLIHESPWVSDYYLADYTASYGQTLPSPFLIYPITMMGHTPFDFGPNGNDTTIYPSYAPFIKNITLKYINYASYYNETIKRYFIGDGGNDQTLDNTVYIFYSDHGPGLKNGDLEVLFDRTLNDLEERKILQQTLAFIYVPSDDAYVDFDDYQIRKGMLVGRQELVRSNVDLYRTMIELFDVQVGHDMYFGVNGLSTEPTFALDNRILDVVTDEYIYSLRDKRQIYPLEKSVDDELNAYIKMYKMLGDYLLSTEDNIVTLNDMLNE